jgi:hypothetical protein
MNFAEMFDSVANKPKKQYKVDNLPDGNYVMEIVSVVPGLTKNEEKRKISWDLKVAEGEYKNRHVFITYSFTQINDESNLKAIDRALDPFKILDMPCDSASINGSMKKLTGKYVEINLKDDGYGPDADGNRGQWKNFRRIVEDVPQGAPAPQAVPQELPEGSVPF